MDYFSYLHLISSAREETVLGREEKGELCVPHTAMLAICRTPEGPGLSAESPTDRSTLGKGEKADGREWC